MKKIIIVGFLFFSLIVACNKNDNNKDDGELFYFNSLTSGNDSLRIGESTKITADVDGPNISYKWFSDKGVILGSGFQITFIVNCNCRFNDVECTATSGKKSETRVVTILIY
jgi:hypothetical protein